MLQLVVISLTLLFILEPVKLQEDEVSKTIQNINIRLVTRALGELRSLKEDLTFLKESMMSLNASVRSLHEQFTEPKEQTATIDTTTQQMNTELNTLISDLSQHKQQTAAESAQFQTSFTQLHHNLTNNLTHQLKTIQQYLESDPSLPVHTCGGTGGWRRVVYLDMTDPSTTCPSGWRLTAYPKRTCGRVSTRYPVCDSVSFPVSGGEYSKVCGRIKAYQWGSPDAFNTGGRASIDGNYVDGVSITHSNHHQHIWTFAAGLSEDTSFCTGCCYCDTNFAVSAPPFVGEDYFCESGIHEQWVHRQSNFVLYPNDPLWDGLNCLSSSTCCSLHNPPYFVKELPSPATANIEARICLNQPHTDEDIAVELVELYVQ